jgi:hypothetical protein
MAKNGATYFRANQQHARLGFSNDVASLCGCNDPRVDFVPATCHFAIHFWASGTIEA